jgi:hypothetical protein
MNVCVHACVRQAGFIGCCGGSLMLCGYLPPAGGKVGKTHPAQHAMMAACVTILLSRESP